jgi:hypothetical protein
MCVCDPDGGVLLPGVVITLACAATRLGRFHSSDRGAGLSSGQPGGPRARVFTASVPGGVITASQTGSGAPVLLLHGGPGLSDYTAPLTAELDDAFTVLF